MTKVPGPDRGRKEKRSASRSPVAERSKTPTKVVVPKKKTIKDKS